MINKWLTLSSEMTHYSPSTGPSIPAAFQKMPNRPTYSDYPSAVPFQTKAGKLGISVNGYRYTKERELIGSGYMYWRCQLRHCKARCKSNSQLDILSLHENHNHPCPNHTPHHLRLWDSFHIFFKGILKIMSDFIIDGQLVIVTDFILWFGLLFIEIG